MVDANKEAEKQSPQPPSKRWNFPDIRNFFKGKPKVPPESLAGLQVEAPPFRGESEAPAKSQPEPQVEAVPFWEEFDTRKAEEYKTKGDVRYHSFWWSIENRFRELPEREFSTQELIMNLSKVRNLSDTKGFRIPVKYMVEHNTIKEMVNVFDSVFSNTPQRGLDRREGIYARPDICVRTLDLILKRLVIKEGRTDLTDAEKDSIGKFFQGLQKVEAKMATDLFNNKIGHSFEVTYGIAVGDLFGNHYDLLFGMGGRLVKAGIEAVQMDERGISELINACEYLSPNQAAVALTALARPILPPSGVDIYPTETLYRTELWNKGLEALSESVSNCPEELKEESREAVITFLRTMKLIINQLGSTANFFNFTKHHPEFEKTLLLGYKNPNAEVIGNLSKRKSPLIDPLVVKLEGLKPRINQEN